MNMKPPRFVIGFFLFLLFSSTPLFAVETFTRWEHTLTSTESYQNPYRDVTLQVEYSGPDGAGFKGYGFWDGGDAFKIRCMFSKAGTWTWKTICSNQDDTGLHQQSGRIEVTPYQGDNPLYRRGYLKVSENRRYLEYGDGTPFLWIGDTAWAAPMHASMEEWREYVRDRAAKHFSVVQIFCSTTTWTGSPVNHNGHPPFNGENLEQWNPAYWRDYEEMVQFANGQGLTVTIVGLMEPDKRYPEIADAAVFARNLAARLMGNFVIFSPSFDSRFMELGRRIGETVRDAAPFHLITQHTGTDLKAAQSYYDDAYLDFCGLQSGAGWGSNPISPETAARTAVTWTLDLYRRDPCKPVVDLEARYDSGFNQSQLPRMPRSCGYWTLLSGAKGYTYGCAGVWFWGKPIEGNDPQADASWSLQEGIAQPSSIQMKIMADFFNGIDWWTLEPAHDLIVNQSDVWTKHIVLACSADGSLAVAYLPDNDKIVIKPQGLASEMDRRWVNPETGESIEAGAPGAERDEWTFARPAGWHDALLLLKAK